MNLKLRDGTVAKSGKAEALKMLVKVLPQVEVSNV